MVVLFSLALGMMAQDSLTDRATLVILEAGREVGRETYVIRPQRLPTGQQGFVLEARSQRRNLAANATVHLQSDGLPTALTFVKQAAGSDRPIRIEGAAGRGRFRIKRTSVTGDALREYPMREGFILADDALFALYTVFGRQVASGRLTFRALNLSLEECCSLSVEDLGVESTALRGAPARLRHFRLNYPEEHHDIWFTEVGELAKVSIPNRQLLVERQGE